MLIIKKGLYNLYSILGYYFIKLISIIFKIRILMIETSAIGHMGKQLEIHVKEREIFKDEYSSNYIDIYFGEKKIANEYLWSRWKEILNISPYERYFSVIFRPIFFYALKKGDFKILIPFRYNFDFLSKLDKSDKIENNKLSPNQGHDIKNVLENTDPSINFNDDEIKKGYKILKDLNIRENDKILLLCVRDPLYRFVHKHGISINTKYEIKNLIYENRDSRIRDYKDLVKYLCDQGYKVIRMGKVAHEKLDLKHSNFVDYPFLDIKSDFLDIFLFKVCHFVLGTGTGLDELSALFRKKKIFLNYGELSTLNFNYEKDVVYVFLKKIYCDKNIDDLNIIQLFEKKLNYIDNFQKFKHMLISFKSLSSNEMINAIQDMEDYIKHGYPEDFLKKNKLVNEYLNRKYNISTNVNWGLKYLEKATQEIIDKNGKILI